MKKDAPLSFRIPADLKKKLLKLAKEEGRSLSQACEILLRIGVDAHSKEGHQYLQKVFSQSGEEK